MRFDFRQRSIEIKKPGIFADSSGVSVNGSVTRFSSFSFLLCCAERALQTCKYRQCDGVAICNEEQPTVVAAGCGGKKAKLLWKKASDSAFRFLLVTVKITAASRIKPRTTYCAKGEN